MNNKLVALIVSVVMLALCAGRGFCATDFSNYVNLNIGMFEQNSAELTPDVKALIHEAVSGKPQNIEMIIVGTCAPEEDNRDGLLAKARAKMVENYILRINPVANEKKSIRVDDGDNRPSFAGVRILVKKERPSFLIGRDIRPFYIGEWEKNTSDLDLYLKNDILRALSGIPDGAKVYVVGFSQEGEKDGVGDRRAEVVAKFIRAVNPGLVFPDPEDDKDENRLYREYRIVRKWAGVVILIDYSSVGLTNQFTKFGGFLLGVSETEMPAETDYGKFLLYGFAFLGLVAFVVFAIWLVSRVILAKRSQPIFSSAKPKSKDGLGVGQASGNGGQCGPFGVGPVVQARSAGPEPMYVANQIGSPGQVMAGISDAEGLVEVEEVQIGNEPLRPGTLNPRGWRWWVHWLGSLFCLPRIKNRVIKIVRRGDKQVERFPKSFFTTDENGPRIDCSKLKVITIVANCGRTFRVSCCEDGVVVRAPFTISPTIMNAWTGENMKIQLLAALNRYLAKSMNTPEVRLMIEAAFKHGFIEEIFPDMSAAIGDGPLASSQSDAAVARA